MGQPRRSTVRNKKIHCNESKSLLIIHWASSSESKLSSFNQTTYVVIPCMVFVEDDGGSKTPCRVNASSSYGDGSQMNQEDCKSNGKGSQNLQNNHELHKWEHAPDCISHQPNQFAAVTRKNTHTHTHTHIYISWCYWKPLTSCASQTKQKARMASMCPWRSKNQ